MDDFIELVIGLLVCVMPPAVLIVGLVVLSRHLRGGRNETRILHLEAAVDELRGQNLTLLQRVSRLEAVSGQASALRSAQDDAAHAAVTGSAPATAFDGPARPPEVGGAAPFPESARVFYGPARPPDAAVAEAAPSEPALVFYGPARPPDAGAAGAAASEPASPQPASATASPRPAREGAPPAGDVTPDREPRAAPGPGPTSGPASSAEAAAAKPGIAWEEWIGVRGAAALGASILVLAGIYFFEYSIEHGLITPAMRVVAGTLVGLGCLGLSELRLRKTHEVLASWIAGAGSAILYVAFWAGQALYALYPTWAAGLLMVATTGACVTLAVHRRSMPIALLGLAGGFITPLALSSGADRPIPLFSYLLMLDAAMLWVAYRRRWPWLALLCLLGTGVYQHAWLLARLDQPRLVLGVAVVGLFAVLFGALPQLRPAASGPDAPESPLWRLTRSAGVLVPLLFTVPLAMRTDLGDTFAVTAVQLVLLSLAAGYVGIRHRADVLPTAAAMVGAFTILGRSLSLPPTDALTTWQPVALAIALLTVFCGLAELERRVRPAQRGLALAGGALTLSLLALSALAAPLSGAAGPWPWLLLWAVAGTLAARLSTLLDRPRLQVASGALVAIGLSTTFAAAAGEAGQPSSGVFLGLLVGGAALAQLAGLLPFRADEARAGGDHAAATLAVLSIPILACAQRLSAVPVWALYASTLSLATLALLAAARRGSAGWLAATAFATAGAHGIWVARRLEGPFSVAELSALGASVALFALFPLLSPRRLRERPWAWRTAALVGPAYLLTLRHVYLETLGSSTIGLLAVGLAVVSLGAAYALRARGPEGADARRVAVVWLTASATGFVTLAVPLQLDNEWITIGWALEAVALSLLFRRLDHAGLKYLALALVVAVFVRLLANPYVLGYYERGALRLLNWLTYTYLVPAACFVGVWFSLRVEEGARLRPWERSVVGEGRAPLAAIAASAAMVVVFAWLNLTIFDWFATGAELTIPMDRLPARDLSLSIAWAAYAISLLGLGMWRRSTALRVASLLLILVTSAKVFLYDLAHLADLYRVASLAGLAISLIIISFAYQRFVFRDERSSEVPS